MKYLFILVFLINTFVVLSQTDDKEQALKYGKEAVKLVDNGKFEDGIKLFEKAQKLDPDNIIYPYEIAYANYMQKKYREAIQLCIPLKNHKDVHDEIFRLIGNCYDILGERDKAIEEYNSGIEKFPNSGKLYHELAICYQGLNKLDEAIDIFEKGISVDPNYSSNYYNLSKIYFNTENEIWALIYSETFINLERNTVRTTEISKLLYDTYKKGIIVNSDKTATVSFCQNPELRADKLLLFETNFEMGFTLALTVTEDKSLSLSSISKIRQLFLKLWYEKRFNEKYNIGLFDYIKDLSDKGYGEVYDYYCMGYGDQDFVKAWVSQNEMQYKNFENYYVKNKLKLNSDNCVYRGK